MACYDCFMFYNELELLDIRLNYLDDVVDTFVLVEANTTHSGQKKPLYYQENRSLYNRFKDKIRVISLDNLPTHDNRWVAENYQRNQLKNGLFDMNPNDMVIISDVDEIPNKEWIKKGFTGAFSQRCYMYYLNVFASEDWRGSVALSYDRFMKDFKGSPQIVRDHRSRIEPLKNGGWHFAWLGGPERIHQKLRAFGHREHDNEPTHARVEECYEKAIPLWATEQMLAVPIDDSYPDYIKDNLLKFEHLIYNKCIGNIDIYNQLKEIVK